MFRSCVLGLALTVLLGVVAAADDSISLPSGTVVKTASFAVHPRWKEAFPPDCAFFAEKYPAGPLKGMHGRYSGRLDGTSVSLHENGTIKMLAYYPAGQRQGAFHLWDEDKHLVFYSQYQDNKKHGITCLFKGGSPWLVQEWNQGDLKGESLVTRKGGEFTVSANSSQLAQAQERLAAAEKDLEETETGVKNNLRKWFVDESDRIRKEKGKVLTQVVKAQQKVGQQVARKEAAEEAHASADAVARSHQAAIHAGENRVLRNTDARVAGDARAAKAADAKESHAAGHAIEAASKNAKAVRSEAKHELSEMDKEMVSRSKHMYQFAMTALEKSHGDKSKGDKTKGDKGDSR